MNLRLCAVSALLACFVATSAAAEAPSIVPFDKATAGNIKTIGVVTMAMPAQPTMWHMGGVAGAFGGLLVGAVEQGLQTSRTIELWKIIDGDNHPPQTTFTNALTTALQANGFAVKLIAAPRPDSEFLENYPADPQVDAYLDVRFSEDCNGYGYFTPGQELANPWKAFAFVSFRLVRASDHTVLAQNTVLHTPWWKQDTENAVTIPPDEAYSFADYQNIRANPKLATEGLNAALSQTANTIGMLLY